MTSKEKTFMFPNYVAKQHLFFLLCYSLNSKNNLRLINHKSYAAIGSVAFKYLN